MSEMITVEAPVEGGESLVVTFREFDALDENAISSPEARRAGRVKTALLQRAFFSLENPGPYEFSDAVVDWNVVTHGHREVILRDLRVKNWGPDYYPETPCPSCSEPYSESFDLSAFPMQVLPASSVEHVKTGKPLVCVLPKTKKKVEFRLRRGKDEVELRKIATQRKDKLSTEFMRLHTLSVEGVGASQGAIREFFEGNPSKNLPPLNSFDASFFRAELDAADAGIDQAAVWTCSACGYAWKTDVEFGSDFFFPKFRRKSG